MPIPAIISAILNGLATQEISKSLGDDPAVKAGVGLAMGKIGESKVPDLSSTDSAMTPPPTQQNYVEMTPAQSIGNKFAEDNYMRRIGERMRR